MIGFEKVQEISNNFINLLKLKIILKKNGNLMRLILMNIYELLLQKITNILLIQELVLNVKLIIKYIK